jgi:kumamolisin
MPGRKVFADSVVELPPEDGLAPNGLLLHGIGPRHDDEPMDVMFSLELPTNVSAELEDRVARGEVVPAKELAGMTAPQEVQEWLVAWLTSHGFTVDHISADGTSVYATSTVSNISEQLQVEMARVTRDGITYNAARTAPSLPEEVGDGVRAIIGLQPFRQANKQSRRVPGVAAAVEDNQPPYVVSDVLAAYGADSVGVTGAGQTIAILIDTAPSTADLKKFWARNGLAINPSQVTRINVAGGQLPPIEGEETLDVEWSSGTAPGARIRLYAAGSLRFTALDRALDRIIADLPTHPGMRQLSISLGLGEAFMGGANGEVAVQHQKFLGSPLPG